MIAFSQTLLAQQSSTAYFMQTLTQTQWLNPAVKNECKLTIGGALVPTTGQLFFLSMLIMEIMVLPLKI